MERRRIGKSSLEVSVIGLGCNNVGRQLDEAATDELVRAALDLGVNFFDTADSYGGHNSEVFLGRALGKRRPDVVIATKFGKTLEQTPIPNCGSRAYIVGAVERSLQRLGTDYIDLYQMHCPDPDTPIEETLGALDDLVRQGKVRFIGNSNFTDYEIADADWSAGEGAKFVSAQNLYSLLEQDAARNVIPACAHYGLAVLPFFPLASGLLTGKYHRGEAPAAGTRLAAHPRAKQMLTDRRFDQVERLTAWAEARGRSILDLAFAWLLGHSVVPSVIAGATRAEQVIANAAAADWRLTPTEVAEVGRLARS